MHETNVRIFFGTFLKVIYFSIKTRLISSREEDKEYILSDNVYVYLYKFKHT